MVREIFRAAFGIILVFWLMVAMAVLVSAALSVPSASAHTGSPSMPTFAAGNRLTYQNLVDALNHLHATFSGGVVDAHLSSSAAIQHSKLQTPALVAKAWLSTTTACDGAGVVGTDCTTGVEHSKFLATSGGAGSGNSALEAGGGGTAGIYNLTLSFNPTNTNYVIVVTSGTAGVYCSTTTRATTAPHIAITCRNDAGTATNANLMVAMFDT